MIEKIDREIQELEKRISQLKELRQLITDDPKRIHMNMTCESSFVSFPEVPDARD